MNDFMTKRNRRKPSNPKLPETDIITVYHRSSEFERSTLFRRVKIMGANSIPNEVFELTHDILEALYTHLPEHYKILFDKNIKKIWLGITAPYMGCGIGDYSEEKGNRLYGRALESQDPQKISEAVLHECGYALFKNIDNTQKFADFLVYYSLGFSNISLLYPPKELSGAWREARRDYEAHKQEMIEKLGDNTAFIKIMNNIIRVATRRWQKI